MDSICLAFFFCNLRWEDCIWAPEVERYGKNFLQALRFEGYRSWDKHLKARKLRLYAIGEEY